MVLAAYFIYTKLTDNNNLHNFISIARKVNATEVSAYVSVIFILMLINWLLESQKWMFLINKVEKISFYKAVESVFCGLTWAVFTPNRIGEYGGRVFFLSPRKRIQGVVAMSVGHIAQMVITNVFGSLALIWFIYRFVEIKSWLFFGIAFLVFVFCIFFILFYFNIKWLDGLLSNIGFLKRFRRFFHVLNRYSKVELGKVMLFSLARFAVFTTQYLLILHFLIPELIMYESAFMVFILFFIQSALPSLDLLDIGVRSVTATNLFALITNQSIAVMAATALIWFVNLIIPAILGSLFVFKINFFGRTY